MRSRDEMAFLSSVREQPDCDVVRLAYADWLQEHGDEARAELIRVQCELARWQPYSPQLVETVSLEDIRDYPTATAKTVSQLKHERRHTFLQCRERELLDANSDRWRTAGPCEKCGGHPGLVDGPPGDWRPTAVPCPACWGTGDVGGLMRDIGHQTDSNESPWLHEVTYHRGMKRVHCRAEDVWREVEVSDFTDEGEVIESDWEPTAWALACAAHPDAVELWVSDREPAKAEFSGVWGYCEDLPGLSRQPQHARLPSPLWDMLPNVHNGVMWKWFDTPDAARTALARAAAVWVRTLAEAKATPEGAT